MAISRSAPIYLNDQKVAEASSTSEDRNFNVSNQIGVDGVLGQAIGAEEVSFDFEMVILLPGTQIAIDDLIGVPVQMGFLRNGRMNLVDGVIGSSNYKSSSKEGTVTGSFKFTGGSANLV